ncbi:MAG: HpsJ family protein [Synechococcales bacterium]|nr:HpsJ family protein [Synechococcales bacterium]
MKSTTSALSAPFVLKVVGYTLILFTLIDYVTLLLPFRFSDDQWLGATMIQFVDRGVIPLMGLAILYAGHFLEGQSLTVQGKAPFITGRFWAIVLACLLGLSFLVTVPIHFMNTNKVATAAIDKINKDSEQLEQNLEAQVGQRFTQLQEQLKNKEQLATELKKVTEVINSGQISDAEQLKNAKKIQSDLEKLQKDPKHLEVMAKEAKEPELQKIRDQRKKLEEQARAEQNRTQLRTGLGSLMLAIGYTLVGWVGLAELLGKRAI